jgi:hypothetical protein
MRHLSLAAVVAAVFGLLVAGPAWAQVAAPNLDPTGILSTSLNPATLQWNASSVAGLGYFTGQNETTSGGVLTNANTLTGPTAQLRLIGDYASVGVETLNLKIKPALGGATFNFTDSQAALAGQLGGFLALGVGEDVTNTNASGTNVRDALMNGGVSIRIAQRLYLGASSGTDTHSGLPFADAKRTITRFGVAYHMHDKMDGVHVEAYHEDWGELALNLGGVYTYQDKEKWDTVKVEVLKSGYLFALTSRKIVIDNRTIGTTSTEHRTGFDAGYVPDKGVSVVGRIESRHQDITPGNGVQERPR